MVTAVCRFVKNFIRFFVRCPLSFARCSLLVSSSDLRVSGAESRVGAVPDPANMVALGDCCKTTTNNGPVSVKIDKRRKEHGLFNLREEDLDADPIRQFKCWFDQASLSEVPEVNAMALATATHDGRPSVRMVLLRGFDERGFTFFTNYESRKARELEANPYAAMVFFWHDLERQVRVEGRIERVSADESDRYFDSRPAGSRLGAWASPQSEVIVSREILETQFHLLESQYPDGQIPRPENWGGYRLVPNSMEFWQGRPNRLHDRLRYTRRPQGGWLIERLAP
jgi:pyridoxamine 5'-phosphate oxidase